MQIYENCYIIKNSLIRGLADLQYRSIIKVLKSGRTLAKLDILDYGSGLTNYKRYFNYNRYATLDINFDADYKSLEEVKDKFDLILLIEVLEHIADPKELLLKLSTYLKKDGQIWISIPFAARIHPYPQDFHRFTEDGLKELCKEFTIIELIKRGNNLSTLSSKVNYMLFRKLKSWYFWLVLLLAPFALILLFWSVINSDEPGLDDDPLGFFIKIKNKK